MGGETARGVHVHKEIKNFQKSSRAICGALSEDYRARTLRGTAGQSDGDIIGPAGSGICLTRVQMPVLLLAGCVISREFHFAHRENEFLKT